MFNKNIILTALLGCSALVYPSLAQAEAVSAKTSWAISRVASTSQGSYCTMAQKYSDDTILTFARNTEEEYSLAIDFKEGQFKGKEKQDVTLSAQGGAPQKFNVTPKSERTIVINIGKDKTLIDKVSNAENLSVDVGGKSVQFAMNEFKTGKVELENCMTGLKSASANTKKLTEDDLVNRQVAVIRTPEIENAQPTAEGLLAAMPMPSADISPAVSPQREAEFIQVKEQPIVTSSAKDNQEILVLREENARLTRAISEQRRSFENQKSSKETALLSELQEKLNTTQKENESLKKNLSSASMAPKEDTSKLKSDLVVLGQSVKSLQDENQSLKTQLAEQKAFAGKSETLANQSQRSNQELEALKAENETLKNQIKIASLVKPEANPSPVIDDDVIKVRNELRQVTSQFDVLKNENNTLKDQIANLQKGSESDQLKAAGGNWDLEQSTRRYQESQREIVRLGALLQAKDTKCSQEKKDIEYMLFDPAIADKAQIAMLNSLEDQVKEKDEKLKIAESKLASADKKIVSEKDEEINQLKKTIIQTKLEHSEKLKQDSQSQDELIASLKIEIDKKNQELTKAQAEIEKIQQASVKVEENKNAENDLTVANLQLQVQQANQQILLLQKQIADSKNTVVQAATVAPVVPDVVSAKSSIVERQVQSSNFKSIDEISSVLKKAGIDVVGSLQNVQGGDPSIYRAYSWKTGSLFGSIEMRQVSDELQFNSSVDQYLARAKTRCKGEFAAIPSEESPSIGSTRAYEIACVGASVSSSASVVFNYGDSIVTTIAHEGRAEAMDLAIDARDKVAAQF